jgi:hypothetical protein
MTKPTILQSCRGHDEADDPAVMPGHAELTAA